ncbi:MAG: VPLPA-CTERM sorting domain-containing protein [Desulfuromonadales bacterium]|nr:VPLPA-CTERM sorting domain-containing protein [Desulfuromonadales bacterium]
MFKKMIVVAALAIIAISAQVGTANAALVNGDFETGDFNGWTVDSINNWAMVINSGSQHAGNFEAQLGTYGTSGTLTHDAFATTAGQEYTVSFWLASDGLNTTNTNVFQALWNGQAQNINPVLNPNLSSSYTQYLFTTIASGTSSTIAFNFQNDPSVFHLDNVDVTPTPIPAAFWLMGSGLAGLAGIRRKKA